MILIGTMHDRPVRVMLENMQSFMVPPSPPCEVCEHDKYQVATRIGSENTYHLICEGCHSEYPLKEDVLV